MIRVDNHVHSKYSQDSRVDIKDIAKSAKEKGLEYIAITDKVDFSIQPIKDAIHRMKKRNDAIDEYGQNNGIKIIKGIEINEPHLYQEEQKMLLEATEMDYVLGSVNHVLGVPIKKMANNPSVVELYLKTLYQMVEEADIDAVAHLDYLKRFVNNPDFNDEMIKEIMKTMVYRGIGLEINTSGIRHGVTTYPSREYIDLYVACGGDKVLYGSSAHQVNEIYDGIEDAKNDIIDYDLDDYAVIDRKFRRL